MDVPEPKAPRAAQTPQRRNSVARSGFLSELPRILLAVAVAESILLLLDYGSGLTFFQDEWAILLHRGGFTASAVLDGANGHIIVIPAGIYDLLRGVFGLTSTMPWRIVATLLSATTAVLVFWFLRSRVGDWLALAAAVLLLFLGPAWQTLLWPLEMARVGSLGAGVAMLIALGRRTPKGDRYACALLTVSVLFFSLGLAFILAAVVDVARRSMEWRRRAFVPAIPTAVYALWYLGYGTSTENPITVHNVVNAPIYLLDSVAASLQSLLGLVPSGSLQMAHPTWGWVVFGLIAVAGLVRLRRGGTVGPQLWEVVAAASATWLLAGATYASGGEATQSRYQYVGAVFVLLILAELFYGFRPRPVVVLAAAAATGLALAGNLSTLALGRDFMHQQTNLARAELGTIEIARRTVEPSFTLSPSVAGTPFLVSVDAASYLAAVAAHGSPAEDPAQLARAADFDRRLADVVLSRALPVTLEPGTAMEAGAAPVREGMSAARIRERGHCATLPATATRKGVELRLRSDALVVKTTAGGPATLRLRRFSSPTFPYLVGTVPGGHVAHLTIPRDRSGRPWHLEIRAARRVHACSAEVTG